MDNQQILDEAPEGATHYGKWDYWAEDVGWYQRNPKKQIRSLDDIKRIAELEKERDKYKAHYDLAVEKDYPKNKFPRQYKQAKELEALKEQDE